MLDIKFKSNNESLDIDRATINLQSNSGLFSSKINNQYISYNFSILSTPDNRRNLKIPHIIESPDNFETFEILMLINNSIEIEGVLTIEDADGQFIKISIQSEDLSIVFLKKNINESDYGSDIDIGPNTSDVLFHAESVNALAYPDTDHVFPMVHSPEFYDGENPEFLGVVNNYDILTTNFVPNTDSPVKNKNTLVPYFFLVFILKKIFETENITLKGSFVDHLEVQKMIVHNNLALDLFDIQQTFVRASLTADFLLTNTTGVHKIIFDDDSTPPNEDTGGDYSTVLGEFTIAHEGILNVKLFNLTVTNFSAPGFDDAAIAIQMFVDGVQKGIWFNPIPTNATITYPEIIASGHYVIIFGNEYYVDTEYLVSAAEIGAKVTIVASIDGAGNNPNPSAKIHAGVIAEFNLDKWTEFNVYEKTISPKNHLPNLTAETFVNAFITGFKLMPYYDKKKREMHLSFFEDVINNIDYDDISHNISKQVVKKLNNTGFTLNYDLSGDDNFPDPAPDISKFQYVGQYDSVDDLPAPPTVSLVSYVNSVNAFYVSLITTGITWERYKEGFDALIIGDGSTPYTINFAPFKMDQISIDNDGAGTMSEFLLATINEVGSSFFYKNGINDPLFKILLWHGDVDGPVASKPYPMASSYNIAQDGSSIGNLTLKLLIDDTSLYIQFLKNYFDFLLNTKKVEHVYTIDFKNPLNYDFLQKKLVGNQRYLTGKLKIKITNRGFAEIKADNFKV